MDSASPSPELPTPADVLDAAQRIAPYIFNTPVLRNGELDAMAGCALYFKCESLQLGGAFKLRGAMNAVWALSKVEAKRGVATHSSGNHGAALARAAKARGIACHVVVPEGAVASKLRNIAAQGATLHRCAATQSAREVAVATVVAETGAVPVHPYDNARVIAGQGTVALELLQAYPDLDVILAPIGGGGLISGTLLAVETHRRRVPVIAAEPRGADDAQRSLAVGHRVLDVVPNTIADGLRATIGVRNFSIIQNRIEAIWSASDPAIEEAMRLVWESLKLVIEPSSAVPLAAILAHGRARLAGLKVGVILTGGNVDLDQLPWAAN